MKFAMYVCVALAYQVATFQSPLDDLTSATLPLDATGFQFGVAVDPNNYLYNSQLRIDITLKHSALTAVIDPNANQLKYSK